MIRRLLSAALVSLWFASPATAGFLLNPYALGSAPPAATEQVILGGSTNATANAADRYAPFGYVGALAAAPATKSFTAPFAFAITEWSFYTRTAPSGAATYDATLVINGTPSAATCKVESTSSPTGECVWTGSVTVAAGDGIDVLIDPTNTPATTTVGYAAIIQPTNPNDTLIVSAARNAAFSTSSGSPQAIYPNSGASPAAIASRRLGILPDGGTISNFYGRSVAPGAAASGKQYDYKIQHNGGDPTSIPAFSIIEDATSNNDTAHSFTVSAGDDIAVLGTASATAPTASDGAFGIKYVPTTAGHYPYTITSTNSDAGGGVFYPLSGGQGTGSATETDVSIPTPSQTFKHMRVKLGVAPGSGKTRRFELMVNGTGSGFYCDVADSATTQNCTGTVAVNDNDKVSLSSSTVVGTSPTTAQIGVALLATR